LKFELLMGDSESIVVKIPIESASSLDEFGKRRRVRAVYKPDGNWYDAIVTAVMEDGLILVQWLRPSPGGEHLHCVCETAGADDSQHTHVPREQVKVIP